MDNREDISNNFNSFPLNIGPTFSVDIPQHKNKTLKTYIKKDFTFNSAD